jgi:hypothetical protein
MQGNIFSDCVFHTCSVIYFIQKDLDKITPLEYTCYCTGVWCRQLMIAPGRWYVQYADCSRNFEEEERPTYSDNGFDAGHSTHHRAAGLSAKSNHMSVDLYTLPLVCSGLLIFPYVKLSAGSNCTLLQLPLNKNMTSILYSSTTACTIIWK